AGHSRRDADHFPRSRPRVGDRVADRSSVADAMIRLAPSLDPTLQSTTEAHAVRLAARAGILRGPTAGRAAGFQQGNLIALPRTMGSDFHRFCDLNPRPCPLLGVAGPGDPFLPTLGEDIDVRTDLPRYRVWRDGVAVDERLDVTDVWRDDLVAFVLGCSFSF